ncbi:hypothetical protein GmHk_13G037745 [Glycine max]|nr:hypothetical protein GmHk_13G037745 [Glycine max]
MEVALAAMWFEEAQCIVLDLSSYWIEDERSNGCVEYDCMELKDDNKVGKMFFIFSQFSSKGSIKLHAIVALKEIYALLRKPRYAEEIIALMCDQ